MGKIRTFLRRYLDIKASKAPRAMYPTVRFLKKMGISEYKRREIISEYVENNGYFGFRQFIFDEDRLLTTIKRDYEAHKSKATLEKDINQLERDLKQENIEMMLQETMNISDF